MALMKIENYEVWKTDISADTFTFPYNPKSINYPNESNHEMSILPYNNRHIAVSGAGFNPATIILNGHFSGSTRWTNWRLLTKHWGQTTKIKKLFFESDKFSLGIPKRVERTNSSNRTNFVDYVAGFETIIAMLFGSTERTTGVNAGNIDTYVFEVSGTYDGSGDVVISDGTNIITIPEAELTLNDIVTYRLVSFESSGDIAYVTEYGIVEIEGAISNKVRTSAGSGILKLASGVNITTVTTTNLTSVSKKFNDGWLN